CTWRCNYPILYALSITKKGSVSERVAFRFTIYVNVFKIKKIPIMNPSENFEFHSCPHYKWEY
ncbi:MAG: hypothetical protein J6P79_01955, partial [Pseudobutyrivibrio sp.]|nr:hypothetical protein [Pseudobutyrivibrio sp.]